MLYFILEPSWWTCAKCLLCINLRMSSHEATITPVQTQWRNQDQGLLSTCSSLKHASVYSGTRLLFKHGVKS